MKLLGIYIYDYLQFKDFEIDFTYPKSHVKAGKPLDKICFIGRNGTGKSNLLNLIQSNIYDFYRTAADAAGVIYKLGINDRKFYIVKSVQGAYCFLKEEVDSITGWKQTLFRNYQGHIAEFLAKTHADSFVLNDSAIAELVKFKNSQEDLLIYIPSEGNQNFYSQITDVPATSLNDALKLFNSFNYYHLISTDTVKNFWDVLTYQIKKRENDLREFEKLDGNLDKTIREVQSLFDEHNPPILDEIAILWNKILGKANLEFDSKNAANPIQLNDNLKAYIKLKGENRIIKYSQLSSGIRNFIFRLGHVYSLYFNREVKNGFLLIDEPENNLYPDFLYDLIETYLNIIKETQLFVATHSPIIAAQFEPYERIILDFNEDGSVFWRNGETPIGDDPNDLLLKDFNVRSLLGKEGVKKWERYIELKLTIPSVVDKEQKSKLLDEFIQIGNAYNFASDEVS
jgi:predicted ATP-dependent endonuclease of OLD family